MTAWLGFSPDMCEIEQGCKWDCSRGEDRRGGCRAALAVGLLVCIGYCVCVCLHRQQTAPAHYTRAQSCIYTLKHKHLVDTHNLSQITWCVKFLYIHIPV